MATSEQDRTLVERILGCRPVGTAGEAKAVQKYVEANGLLGDGETFLAGCDDTWLSDASRGHVLTDGRLFRYSTREVHAIVLLDRVDHLRVRRMWYPGVPLVSRGEVFGDGPILILRFRFTSGDGTTRRLRLQTYAAILRPFVEGLVGRFPGRVEVARTLPGF
ncbi:MAG: hypothetical protein HUU06_06760 [Planctomycetaceae bacterium]|nr:hypothetical protein [Planctomycetota bacterium]NUN52472.1 hypothetical protein [Planctomycetaceae bacterium]